MKTSFSATAARGDRRRASAWLRWSLGVSMMLAGCGDTSGPGKTSCDYAREGASQRVPVLGRPFGLDVSSEGVVVVTLIDVDSVTHGKLPDPTLSRRVPVRSGPVRVKLSGNGARAYVANQFDESLSVVTLSNSSHELVAQIQGAPISLAVAGDERVYVGSGAGNITVINTGTRAVIRTISLTGEINGLSLHPQKPILYASSRTGGLVWEISTTSGEVLRTFQSGGTPQDIAVSRDGAKLFVADEDGPLQVWNLTTGALTNRVIPAERGFGLALAADGRHLVVSSSLDARVHVVNVAAESVVRSFHLGGTPRRVALWNDKCTVVVSNEGGWVDYIN